MSDDLLRAGTFNGINNRETESIKELTLKRREQRDIERDTKESERERK
jgi:hypothetical protein